METSPVVSNVDSAQRALSEPSPVDEQDSAAVRTYQIARARDRAKLPVRAAPYYQSLGRCCAIGYRRTLRGPGTWIARWTNSLRVHTTRSLGRLDELDFRQACADAHRWFSQCRSGVARSGTVDGACRDHVNNLRVEKGEQSSSFVEGRFKAHVYDAPIAVLKLDKLSTRDVEQWRNGLLRVMKKSSANRVLRDFKSALNYVARRDHLDDKSWRYVRAFKGPNSADGVRTIYLSVAQRSRLIQHAHPDLANLIRGLLFTAARPLSGAELPVAKVSDFDPQQKNLTLRNYKGDGSERKRVVPLSDSAVEFFTVLSKDKQPCDYLFTKGGNRWQRHMWSNGIEAAMRKANKKADEEGVPADRLPYDTCAYTMRHCAITDRLKAGISIGRVAKDAGTSIAMIEKHYAKFLDDGDVRAKLDTVTAW